MNIKTKFFVLTLTSLVLCSCNPLSDEKESLVPGTHRPGIPEAPGPCVDEAFNASPCTTINSRYVTATGGANVTGWSNSTASTDVGAAIPNGFYAGKSITFTDADLLSSNLLNGVSVFGVTGNLAPATTYPANTPFFVMTKATFNGCLGFRSSSLTYSGTTATFTTNISNHFMNTGDSITISGAVPAEFNGTFTITVTGDRTFTYTMGATPASDATTQGTGCPGSGGLARANEACLGDLTTNTNWQGYTRALADGRLVAAKVKAFLCDVATCTDLSPTTTYYFANGSDGTAGGGSFTTNAGGYGPGDAINWARGDHLGGILSGVTGSTRPWTGRSTGAATLWNSTPDASTCTGWTSTAGNGMGGVSNATGNTRWRGGTTACTNFQGLLCFVNP